MMKNTFLLIFFYCFFFESCINFTNNNTIQRNWSDLSKLNSDEKIGKGVWDKFKKTILTQNILALKNTSCQRVFYSEIDNYIPFQVFYENHVHTIFNSQSNKFYFNDENIINISIFDKKDSVISNLIDEKIAFRYKVLEVGISDKKCKGGECSETIFSFIYIEDKYKFYSVITIP